ncbi:MAG TPA: hypothetical protein VD963_10095 [Phycisphaerales bacterium]|nr:hypothetical protein [Phycisphaerales bacterium]
MNAHPGQRVRAEALGARRSGRGHALSGLVLALFVLLVALVTWKTVVQLGLVPAAHPFASKVRGRIVTVNVLAVLVGAALAGGIGAACFFAFRRSERAAQLGMTAPLLLLVGTFGYQMGNYLVNGPAPPGGGTPASRTGGAQGTGTSSAPPPAWTPEERRQVFETLRSIPDPRGPAVAPRPDGPRPAPRPPDRPAPSADPRPSMPATAPAPGDAAPDPKVERVLGTVRAGLDEETSDLAERFTALAGTLADPPAHTQAAVLKRLEAIGPVREAARALAERLRRLGDEVQQGLEDEGIASGEAMGEAIRFTHEHAVTSRAFAAEAIARLCEEAAEEATYLKENYPKWRLDRARRVTSSDLMVEGHARGIRSRIEMTLARRDELVAQLRGEQ